VGALRCRDRLLRYGADRVLVDAPETPVCLEIVCDGEPMIGHAVANSY